MNAKHSAAIMTGPIARPSRPSVRFTALPAPTMMKAPKITKNQPRSNTSSLKNGNASEVANGGRPRLAIAKQAAAAISVSSSRRMPARKAPVALLGDLQIVVVEADQPERERHAEHDPDVRVGRVGPQHGRDGDAGEDHQPAHGRRAALGLEMRLRPVLADRLSLALAQAQMVDDPRPEQEHEHHRRHRGAAGAHRQIAEDIEHRNRAGEIREPIQHRFNLVASDRLRPARSGA